jgi:PAS domain S-box-containing protein
MRRLLTLLAPTRRPPLAYALIAGAIIAALAAVSGVPGEIDSLHFILAVVAISTLLVAAALAERHKAEQRAKAAETRLRDAIESIGAGFALFDRDDRLVVSNETHKRMYPKNRALMVPGTKFADILRGSVDLGQHPDAAGRAEEWIAARLQRHLDPGEPFEQDRGDGHWLLIGEQRTSEGGIVGTWTDISQQKRQELQLRQSEDRLARALQTLQALIEICPLAIIEVDREMTVSSWNPAAQTIFGWTESEAVGKPLPIMSQQQLDGVRHKILPKLDSSPVIEMEAERRSKDGRKINASLWITARRDDAGVISGYVAFVADITARKRMEGELRHSHRMQAVGQLTGGIAHEFNNLLLVILGNTEILTSMLADNPAGARLADRVLQAGQRGSTLTQQLLAYSSRQMLKPVTIDVGQMLGEIESLARASVGDTVSLHIAAGPGIDRINADRAQLETALLNLVINGRDALRSGDGAIIIRAKNTPLDDGAAAKLDLDSGRYVTIEVSDNGKGMAPEVLTRAIEPFFTTKDVGQGPGLGLSMVHGFVKQSGGHLHIDSEPDVGTVVCVTLPAAIDLEERQDAMMDMAPRSGLSVLIVEDEPAVLEISTSRIESLGYRALTATDGPDALRLIERQGPPDILFTDMVMPGGMSGAELARSVLAKHPSVRVVFTTGNNEEFDGDEPGVSLLLKPYLKAELAQVLRESLGNGPDAGGPGGTGGQVVPFPQAAARRQGARSHAGK